VPTRRLVTLARWQASDGRRAADSFREFAILYLPDSGFRVRSSSLTQETFMIIRKMNIPVPADGRRSAAGNQSTLW
jgi:hypothetical protein